MPVGTSYREGMIAGDEGATRAWVQSIEDAFSRVADHTGLDLTGVDSTALLNPPPTGVSWTVTGVDGKYKIAITNPSPGVDRNAGAMSQAAPGDFFAPNDPRVGRQMELTDPNDATLLRKIIHQFQSGTDTNFDNNSSVTTYGPSVETSYDITDPNVTKFWRIRSRFENSDFGPWTFFVSAAVCGPIGVYSGLLRSWALSANASKNSSNNANVTAPDVDAGSCQVRVYGPGGVGTNWNRYANDATGAVVTSAGYPATSFTGKPYNTTFYVAYNPTANTFLCVTDYSQTLPDGYFWVGSATSNSAFGGTGGSSGGGAAAAGARGGAGRGLVS